MTSPQDPADPQNTNATPAAEAEAAKSASPEQPAAPAERPRPAFGEYAPEGWSWQPPGEEGSKAPGQDAASPQATPAEIPAPQFGAIIPGSTPPAAKQAGAAQSAVPPTLAGVPHNLGVGQQRPGSPQAFAAPASAPAPTSAPGNLGVQAPNGAAGAPAYAAAQPAKRRVGDRVVTILLLVVGTIGALYFSLMLLALPQFFAMVAEGLGKPDWDTPASISTTGTVGVFIMLVIYALTLISSVQRMRRGLPAFFFPLIGGALATVVLFVIMSIAMGQAPEIFANITPEQMQQVAESLLKSPK